MRILFLRNGPHLSESCAGVDLNVHFLAMLLQARGHDVAIGARGGAGEIVGNDTVGYRIFRGPDERSAALAATVRFQPEVTVNIDHALQPVLREEEQTHDAPALFYEHSFPTGVRPGAPALSGRALCATASADLTQLVRQRFGIGSLIVPPLFGIDRYAGRETAGRSVCVVPMGRQEGGNVLLHLARRWPDITFVTLEAGDPASQALPIDRAIAECGNIRCERNRPDMSEVLLASRLVLIAAPLRDGLGRIVTECQFMGVPTLASNGSNLRNRIGEGGVLIEAADMTAWERNFDRIWDRATEWQRLSDLARAHAQRSLTNLALAAERFEFMLHAARPGSWPRQGRLVPLARPRRQPNRIDRGDLALVAKLQRQIEAVSTTPADSLRRLSQKFAAVPHPASVRRMAQITGMPLEPQAKNLGAIGAANREEVVLQCLKGLSAEGWHPDIELYGKERLDAALAQGKGAILWVVHSAFAPNVVKIALHRTGYRVSHTSRPEHGVSSSLLGMQCLNRVRTDFEDRFLVERIRIDRNRPASAVLRARSVLKRNEVVSFTAGDFEGSRAIEVPFMTGGLRLATGPMRLAQLTGAPLLPVSGILTTGPTSFRVDIEKPIVFPDSANEIDTLSAGGAQFAAYVARDLIRHPAQLRGWGGMF